MTTSDRGKTLAAGIRACADRVSFFDGDRELRILFEALHLDQAKLKQGRSQTDAPYRRAS